MKIVHLVPGAGGTFYCPNCLRDMALVKALRKNGHDVTIVPLYLPILIDADGVVGDVPVFFGGINVYLQQKSGVFRKTPRWLDKVFDSDWMLRQAALREGSTEAAGLGPLTLSMLQGRNGNQKKELERLIEWLRENEKPDIIHISNSLLLGLAHDLKEALGVSIVCSLQDEEMWLDAINPPFDQQCWDAMSKCAEGVDAFVSVSHWYGEEMVKRMHLAPNKMKVVPLGIDLTDRDPAPMDFNPPTIGFLSKMSESLGLGLLTDAFIKLKRHPGLSNLRLRATGGMVGHDIDYVRTLKAKLAENGLDGDAEFVENFDASHRRDFLKSLSVLSVPAVYGESFGMFIAEAMATGVPVVEPAIAAFPEVVNETGGGVLYDPSDPDGLVNALESLLLDPERARALGAAGRKAIFEQFGVERMASDMSALYNALA